MLIMKKTIALISALLLLSLSSSAMASEKLTLMLDWFPNIDHLPVYVAQDLGYFSEAGIDLSIITPSETSDGLKLAASGTVDLAVSYEPQTIIAASTGLDIKAVGRLVEHPLTTLLFLDGKGIARPEDLNGAKIGYTVPGLMDVLLDAFAAINGIHDYTPVNVGFSIVPALVSEQVSAVMGPFKTYETVGMAQNGYKAGYFELEAWGIPDYEELIFVAGPKALKTKADAIKAFSSAVEKAIAYTRQNSDEALKRYLAAVPDADVKTETDAFALTLPYYAHPGLSNAAAWQTFADFALKHGLIETKVDAGRLIHTW